MKDGLLKLSSNHIGSTSVVVRYKMSCLAILFLFSYSIKSDLYHVVHSVSLNKLFNMFMIYFQYERT